MRLKRIPQHGMEKDQVLRALNAFRDGDADWRGGRLWSLVYHLDDTYSRFLKEAYGVFFSENALSPVAFPSLRRMENDVVAMTASLLGGGETAAGTMTSGGSESLLLAVKTARDWARATKPHIVSPEMVLPVTAHPALWKAASYFDIKPVFIPVDEAFRADLEAAGAAVGDNTILLVGSAPAYPQGIMDPIPELALLAKSHGLWFHVDACLGGFLLPWLKRLGYPVGPFDLSVEGVCSMSADLHKYGFAAKGASVLLYRDEALRRHQFFACADWPGGLYASPGMTGTRPGGAVAAAWAALHALGEEGYLKMAEGVMGTARTLMEGIEAIPGLYVLGKPDMTVFAFGSESLDIYLVAEAMSRRGWHVDMQQLPPCAHLMVMPTHAPVVDTFLADLREAAGEAAAADRQTSTGMAALYGMVGALVDRKAAEPFLLDYLSALFRPEA